MGNKTKLLDPKVIESLYNDSSDFKRVTQDAVDDIKVRFNQLADPAFLDGMIGDKGETCVESIKSGVTALEDLMEKMKDTTNSIDKKLTGIVTVSKGKSALKGEETTKKGNIKAMKLKR